MRFFRTTILTLVAVVIMAGAGSAVKADPLSVQSGGFSLSNLGNDGSVPNGLDSLVGSAESNTLQFNGPGTFIVTLNQLMFEEGFTGIASVGSHDFAFSQALTINGQTQIMDLFGRIDIGFTTDTIHILSSSPLVFDFSTFTVDVNVLPLSIFGPGNGCYFDVLKAQIQVNTCAPDPVPEPATLTLLGLGIAGVAAKVRQRRRQSALKKT
ncbi:MAG TPA: PEP-CTERM sorting domain-containing protein [Pyrinomonadaceae bacterium]|nr:PEP-CTERM sorting domain-containing protein [Pyrinomonadaceae bacterium]